MNYPLVETYKRWLGCSGFNITTLDSGIFKMDMKITARQFAIAAHGAQKYGNQPYSVHLDSVAEIAKTFGETATIVAYLHDVVEDTAITLTEVEAQFGSLVAECVGILTDEPGSDRQQRKAKTYAKMAKVDGELELALIVKAADRLSNMRACIETNYQRKLDMYQKEHPVFRTSVYRAGICDDIWSELDSYQHKQL